MHADSKNVICIALACSIVEMKKLVFYSLCDKHCILGKFFKIPLKIIQLHDLLFWWPTKSESKLV